MSLRAIEMQIAIPRTQEAGKLQEQLQYRTTQEQALLQINQDKNTIRKQTSSESIEKSRMNTRHDGGAFNKPSSSDRQHKEAKDNDNENIHPYKGKQIDISL